MVNTTPNTITTTQLLYPRNPKQRTNRRVFQRKTTPEILPERGHKVGRRTEDNQGTAWWRTRKEKGGTKGYSKYTSQRRRARHYGHGVKYPGRVDAGNEGVSTRRGGRMECALAHTPISHRLSHSHLISFYPFHLISSFLSHLSYLIFLISSYPLILSYPHQSLACKITNHHLLIHHDIGRTLGRIQRVVLWPIFWQVLRQIYGQAQDVGSFSFVVAVASRIM